MTRMPHLPLMQWDYRDQLQATAQQVVKRDGTPETTYYVYDAGGQRVRKVTERQAAAGQTPTRKAERIYLGGFEIYREYNGSAGTTLALERETLHIMDDKQRIALVETKTTDISVRQALCRDSSFAISSATTSARPAWSWTTTRRSSPTRSTPPTAARRIRRCAARPRRQSGTGIRGRSGMRRVGCTTTGRGITRRGWGGGRVATKME